MSQPAGEPAPAGAPVVPEPAPAAPVVPAFDPANPPAEVKAWLDAERKRIASDEAAKARLGSKASARQEAIDEVAKLLGIKPGDADPAEIARQLESVRGEARGLKIDKALGNAARGLKADEDLVGAVLSRAGKLKDLDPAATDFDAKVKALVEEAVTANPRLKLEATPVPPAAGGQAPVNGGFNGTPTGGTRTTHLGAAVAKHYGK